MSPSTGMWADLAPVGRDAATGGYRRFAWTRTDADAARVVPRRGRRARPGRSTLDRAGNLWAWTADPDVRGPGLVLGSHLDSVPDGGAFDGPLGIVSAFAALDLLRPGGVPAVPSGIACFADEEGARFGVACAGSRLLTGVLDPDRARGADRRRRHHDGRGDDGGRPRPGAPRPGRRDAAPDRHLRRAARRAGPRARRAGPAGRRGRRRSGRTAAGGSTCPAGPTTPAPPGWPTATTRCSPWPPPCWRPARPPTGTARVATVGKVRVAAQRRQRDPVGGHRLARRPRRRRGRRPRGRRARSARRPAPSRSRSRGPRPPRFDAGLRDRLGDAARRRAGAARPAPATTPASSPRPASRPRCCSSATRPGSPTPPPSTPSRRRLPAPASTRSPRVIAELGVTDLLVRARLARTHGHGCVAVGVRIVVDGGRITAVEPGRRPRVRRRRLAGVVLPGFANAHSHAFHRALRGRTHDRGGTFWTWRERMYAVAARLDPDRYLALARATYAEMALAGITCGRRVPLPAPPAGGGRYDDPNAMARGAGPGRGRRRRPADPARHLLPRRRPRRGGHLPLDDVQLRFSDGDADAWAARVAALARAARACGSARRCTRCARCRRDQLPTVVAAARRPAAARAPVRAAGRERGLPRRTTAARPPALLADAGRARPATPPRCTPPTSPTTTSPPLGAQRHGGLRLPAAPRPTSPTASARSGGCGTPGRRSASAPTSTR